MTIKIIEDGLGLYGVYVDGRLEGHLYNTYPSAFKFAKKLANSPKPVHEWEITKNSKKDIVQGSGPKWWHWVLMVFMTVAIFIVSVGK